MNNLQITDDNRRRGFMKILSTVGMGLGISSVGFAQNQSADGQSENLIKKGKVNSTGGYFNVKDFGATGNRDVRDIGAIQEAVKKCKESGGGTIYFPPGIYISGTIWLYDDMTVHIDSGAVILESYIEGMETIGKYRPHLICADGAKNVAVIGFGSVKGQGEKMTHNSLQKERGFRSGMLFFQNCTNVKIRDINIFDSDSWTVHLKGCKQVFIDSISIKNDINRKTSNDGIDINACKYVHISNCHIITSDDCIVLKTNDLTFPDCENIVVNNCTLETLCSAIKIGSETRRNFRDIVFSNCVIKNTSQGISMYLVDGGTIERVIFSNITIHNLDERLRIWVYPVLIHVSQRNIESRLGIIRDLTMNNIQIKSNYGIVIQGTEKSNIENLKIQNINFRVDENLEPIPRRMGYKYGPKFGAEQMDENEYNINNYHPAYINVSNVTDLDIGNIRIYMTDKAGSNNGRSGISLDGVDQAMVTNCFVRTSNNAIKNLHTTDTKLLNNIGN